MKLLTLFICLVACFLVQAQCSYENVYDYYNHPSATLKIIETNDGGHIIATSVGADTTQPGDVSNFDLLIIKNDSCGNNLWTKKYSYIEGSFDSFNDIIELADGTLMLLTTSENDGIGGDYNLMVWKLESDGELIWNQFYGGGRNTSEGYSITFNKHHNSIIIAGLLQRTSPTGYLQRGYLLEIDTAGNTIRERDIIINSLEYSSKRSLVFRSAMVLQDGNILGILSATYADSIYAVKLDSNFNIIWIKYPLLSTFKNASYAVIISANKSKTHLALYFSVDGDNYIAEIDSSSAISKYNKQTVKTIPSGRSRSLVPTNDNGYILGYDLLMLDSNLQQKSFKRLPDDIKIQGYAQMRNGSIVYAGRKEYDSFGNSKVYVAQTNTKGWILSNTEFNLTDKAELKIYPNPVNSILNIEYSKNYSSIKLSNLSGKVLLSDFNSTQLDASVLPNGFYVLSVLGPQNEVLATRKVIVLH